MSHGRIRQPYRIKAELTSAMAISIVIGSGPHSHCRLLRWSRVGPERSFIPRNRCYQQFQNSYARYPLRRSIQCPLSISRSTDQTRTSEPYPSVSRHAYSPFLQTLVNGSTIALSYYNNILSTASLIPLVFLTGEAPGALRIFTSRKDAGDFLWGVAITVSAAI